MKNGHLEKCTKTHSQVFGISLKTNITQCS
jgi:hypothetical protein